MLNALSSPRRSARAGNRPLRLADGTRVIVRPIHEQDAAQFARAYTRLSTQSRRRRYLSVAKQLPPKDLRYLTCVDHDQHVALVAVVPQSGEVIGSARYIRLPARAGEAELAIEVIDDWQRRGVGRGLLVALSEHARAHGIERFIAIVAVDNVAMQRAVSHAATSVDRIDGELEYLLEVESLRSGVPTPAPPASAVIRGSRSCPSLAATPSRSPQQEIVDYQSPREEITKMVTKVRLPVADAKTVAAAAEAHIKFQELSIPISPVDASTYVPHLIPVGGVPDTSGQGAIEKTQAAAAGGTSPRCSKRR